MARFVMPSAAIRATRSSLGVSASTPLLVALCGRLHFSALDQRAYQESQAVAARRVESQLAKQVVGQPSVNLGVGQPLPLALE